MASSLTENFLILGPSKRTLARRGRTRRSGAFLQALLNVCEQPGPTRRAPTPSGPQHAWLETNLPLFFQSLGHPRKEFHDLITDHAGKCYPHRERWEKAGIPFCHGEALYLLSYTYPYSTQVRETDSGWTDVEMWVIDNYPKFASHLPPPSATS